MADNTCEALDLKHCRSTFKNMVWMALPMGLACRASIARTGEIQGALQLCHTSWSSNDHQHFLSDKLSLFLWLWQAFWKYSMRFLLYSGSFSIRSMEQSTPFQVHGRETSNLLFPSALWWCRQPLVSSSDDCRPWLVQNVATDANLCVVLGVARSLPTVPA